MTSILSSTGTGMDNCTNKTLYFVEIPQFWFVFRPVLWSPTTSELSRQKKQWTLKEVRKLQALERLQGMVSRELFHVIDLNWAVFH